MGIRLRTEEETILDGEQSLIFLLRHSISPPFLPLICIILPFRSAREALRKKGRPLAV